MTNHDDLHRDIGRMEGRLGALENRLEKMEAVLERIDQRLAKIESNESERRGGWKYVATAATLLSGFVAWVVSMFMKGG